MVSSEAVMLSAPVGAGAATPIIDMAARGFYTDGFGCHQTLTHKLAAWAYAQLSANGEPLASASGVLARPQAYEARVYEAELWAVLQVLRHSHWDVNIGTDSVAVLKGWMQGPRAGPSTVGKYVARYGDKSGN
eukprot:6473491-Amphidinium_carterae.1